MDYQKLWNERESGLRDLEDFELNMGATAHEACLFEIECLKELQPHAVGGKIARNKEMVGIVLAMVMKKKGREAEACMRLLIDAYMNSLDKHVGMIHKIDSLLSQLTPDQIRALAKGGGGVLIKVEEDNNTDEDE